MADVDKFAKDGVLRILSGNKCDLEHQRKVSKDEGKELASKYGINYIETSAKETTNIEELFFNTTETFLNKQISGGNKKNISPGGIDINQKDDTQDKKSSGFCYIFLNKGFFDFFIIF